MSFSHSHSLFVRAQRCLPGGVNSPVRSFQAVGGEPFFVDHAQGPYLFSVDNRRYLDYVGSYGPMIAGHHHPTVQHAVEQAVARGLSYGTPCPAEVTLAETLTRLVPSCEMIRMVNSGTEATLSAIRLARGATGRERIVKFQGCYHGHSDSFLVNGGSGMLTLGIPSSPGVPSSLSALTTTLHFNDCAQVEDFFRAHGDDIAAVIVEPVMGNANCILPAPGFLQQLRTQCTRHGALLIFDEVMTGFRVALGGAQAHYGVTPDLTTLGKIIGGGMPVGAFGGRTDLMQQIAPLGPIYQAGTLSGNPIAMAAGLAMLDIVQEPDFYARLAQTTERLCVGLEASAQAAGIALTTNHIGGMFGLFFSAEPVTTYAQAVACDRQAFQLFFHAMLERNIYFAPSPFEAGFVSSAHDDTVIEATVRSAAEVFAQLRASA